MEKIIGIIGCKEKKLTSYMLGEVLKYGGYLEKNDVKILEINLEEVKDISKLAKKLDIIIDIDMTLDRSRKNRQVYLDNKVKLINNLAKDSLLIINSDDKESINHSRENKKCIVMTYGLNAKSSITTSSIDFDDNIKFNLCLQRKLNTLENNHIEQFEHPISTNLKEIENLYSTLAAICALLYLDIDINLIAKSISNTEKMKCIN